MLERNKSLSVQPRESKACESARVLNLPARDNGSMSAAARSPAYR